MKNRQNKSNIFSQTIIFLPRFALIILLLISSLAYPMQVAEAAITNYYVSTTGSDSNSGTSVTKPFRHIQTAINKVSAGGTIFIMGGTYYESLNFSRSGSASAPIKLTRYNNLAVTINGGSNPALLINNPTVQYWIVQGLRLSSSGDLTISFSTWGCNGSCNGVDHWTFLHNYISGAISIYGAYNRFQGNHVNGSANDGNGGNGITDRYGASHHNVFKGNTVHDFSNRGFWSMTRTHDDIFDGNTIYNITSSSGGRGINLDGFGTVEYRHIVKNNKIYNCSGAAVSLENAFAVMIENNIMHDINDESIGIILYGPTVASPGTKKCAVGGESNQYGDTDGDNNCEGDISDTIIRNNLIYNGGTSSGIYIRHAGGIKIYGNTIHNQVGFSIFLDSSVKYTPHIELVGNIFSKSGRGEISLIDYQSISKDSNNLFYPTSSNNVYISRTNWKFLSLATYHTTYKKGFGSLEANPLFVDSSRNNFHLQASSPAIDKGTSIGVNFDIEWDPRPVGVRNDIGAFEGD